MHHAETYSQAAVEIMYSFCRWHTTFWQTKEINKCVWGGVVGDWNYDCFYISFFILNRINSDEERCESTHGLLLLYKNSRMMNIKWVSSPYKMTDDCIKFSNMSKLHDTSRNSTGLPTIFCRVYLDLKLRIKPKIVSFSN